MKRIRINYRPVVTLVFFIMLGWWDLNYYMQYSRAMAVYSMFEESTQTMDLNSLETSLRMMRDYSNDDTWFEIRVRSYEESIKYLRQLNIEGSKTYLSELTALKSEMKNDFSKSNFFKVYDVLNPWLALAANVAIIYCVIAAHLKLKKKNRGIIEIEVEAPQKSN